MLELLIQLAPAKWGWNSFHDSKFSEKRESVPPYSLGRMERI